MDIDSSYTAIRNRLDTLGFCQPLPIGALGVVSAILDDLLQTTDSFKKAKYELIELKQEKVAWDLGCEPYKCDNAKLLSECNSLHLELIKQRDKFDTEKIEIAKRVRNLELDKKYLEEHCNELGYKLRELEIKYAVTHGKDSKNGINMSKKPFITTVKSGITMANPLSGQSNDTKCTKCSCIMGVNKFDVIQEIQRLQNDTKTQAEMMDSYKKQLDSRDREIQRLNVLLSGGRPPVALAKDCCFRGVNNLQEDVQALQKEKTSIQVQLRESMKNQHEAMQRAMQLVEKNQQLEKDLKELEKIALSVESEANLNIIDKDKQNSVLRLKLDKSKIRISDLEVELNKLRLATDNEFNNLNLQTALKEASDEKKKLQKKLNEFTLKEKELLNEVEKLTKKNSKIKMKLINLEKNLSTEKKDCVNEMSAHQSHRSDDNINKLKKEKDYYQSEYIKLYEKYASNDQLEVLQKKLMHKETEISSQKCEINQLKQQMMMKVERDGCDSSRSVQATIHRIERERDLAKSDAERLRIERDELRNKLKIVSETHTDDSKRFAGTEQELLLKIAKLDNEKRELLSSQIPSQTAVHMLKEDVNVLKSSLKEAQTDNSQIKTNYNQLKLLQEQTEKSLADYQNKLVYVQNQLGHAETKLKLLNTNNEQVEKDLLSTRQELSQQKAMNVSLEQEKDKLLVDLDLKTEKLYNNEIELKALKTCKLELEVSMEQLQRKLDKICEENVLHDSKLRDVSSESDTLRKQVATLKRVNDNALNETGRLTNELTDVETELTITRRKLTESLKEVDSLKQQLQQYVQEVQRAEDLLSAKDRERAEMLEHYRSLSQDAIVLEGNNHSLEMEAAEAKKLLDDAECKLNSMQHEMTIRESELNSYEKQITDLSRQVAHLETELENTNEDRSTLKADLQAVKELCNKLDLQKDRINAELEEHSTIRQQLEKENEKLRSELLLTKTGDKAAVDGLQELLASSRKEIEQYRLTASHLNQDVTKLRTKVDDLQSKLLEAHSNSTRNEALAKEYHIQVEELRRILTNDRFAQVRSREDSCRMLNVKENSNKHDSLLNKEIPHVIAAYAVPEIKLNNRCNLFSNICTYEASNNQAINAETMTTENCFPSSIFDKNESICNEENNNLCTTIPHNYDNISYNSLNTCLTSNISKETYNNSYQRPDDLNTTFNTNCCSYEISENNNNIFNNTINDDKSCESSQYFQPCRLRKERDIYPTIKSQCIVDEKLKREKESKNKKISVDNRRKLQKQQEPLIKKINQNKKVINTADIVKTNKESDKELVNDIKKFIKRKTKIGIPENNTKPPINDNKETSIDITSSFSNDLSSIEININKNAGKRPSIDALVVSTTILPARKQSKNQQTDIPILNEFSSTDSFDNKIIEPNNYCTEIEMPVKEFNKEILTAPVQLCKPQHSKQVQTVCEDVIEEYNSDCGLIDCCENIIEIPCNDYNNENEEVCCINDEILPPAWYIKKYVKKMLRRDGVLSSDDTSISNCNSNNNYNNRSLVKSYLKSLENNEKYKYGCKTKIITPDTCVTVQSINKNCVEKKNKMTQSELILSVIKTNDNHNRNNKKEIIENIINNDNNIKRLTGILKIKQNDYERKHKSPRTWHDQLEENFNLSNCDNKINVNNNNNHNNSEDEYKNLIILASGQQCSACHKDICDLPKAHSLSLLNCNKNNNNNNNLKVMIPLLDKIEVAVERKLCSECLSSREIIYKDEPKTSSRESYHLSLQSVPVTALTNNNNNRNKAATTTSTQCNKIKTLTFDTENEYKMIRTVSATEAPMAIIGEIPLTPPPSPSQSVTPRKCKKFNETEYRPCCCADRKELIEIEKPRDILLSNASFKTLKEQSSASPPYSSQQKKFIIDLSNLSPPPPYP